MYPFDIYLMRLRFEILNVSLEDIASDNPPLTADILGNEATKNGWKQWWPTTHDLRSAISLDDGSPDPYDEATLLEEGADLYIKEARIRLQVFNLAKDLHLAHKYAAFESALINKAHSLVDQCTEPTEVRQLTMSLKDLPGKMAAAGLAISQGDDGVPTVIIRDLSGTRS